jgi:hypothetical protein
MNFIASCALLFLIASAASAEKSAHFEAGNRAFEDKKYLEARQQYEQALAQGDRTASVFYNLGSANQQIGADGLAMLNYERALALNPRHREAYAALDLLRKNSTAKLPPQTWREKSVALLTFDQWLIVGTTAGWIAVFSILIPLARRRSMSFGTGMICIFAIFAAVISATAAWLKAPELDAAIIVAKQVEARLAPADRAALADTLPSGSRVVWLNERSGWVECRLPGGTRAWIPASTVERVRVHSS